MKSVDYLEYLGKILWEEEVKSISASRLLSDNATYYYSEKRNVLTYCIVLYCISFYLQFILKFKQQFSIHISHLTFCCWRNIQNKDVVLRCSTFE